MKRRTSDEIRELVKAVKNDLSGGEPLTTLLKKHNLPAALYYKYTKNATKRAKSSKATTDFSDNEILSIVKSNLDKNIKQRLLSQVL